jgi:hypothetical protein
MRKILNAVVLASLLLSGCTGLEALLILGPVERRATPVSLSDARQVPNDRLLAYQEETPGYRLLLVTRDKSFQGGGCFVGLEINGVLSGRFDPEESARFHIPTSEAAMRVVPDPLARGLCFFGGWTPMDQHFDLSGNSENIFRITLGARTGFRMFQVLP